MWNKLLKLEIIINDSLCPRKHQIVSQVSTSHGLVPHLIYILVLTIYEEHSHEDISISRTN